MMYRPLESWAQVKHGIHELSFTPLEQRPKRSKLLNHSREKGKACPYCKESNDWQAWRCIACHALM
jgi:hypothetical protein